MLLGFVHTHIHVHTYTHFFLFFSSLSLSLSLSLFLFLFLFLSPRPCKTVYKFHKNLLIHNAKYISIHCFLAISLLEVLQDLIKQFREFPIFVRSRQEAISSGCSLLPLGHWRLSVKTGMHTPGKYLSWFLTFLLFLSLTSYFSLHTCTSVLIQFLVVSWP